MVLVSVRIDLAAGADEEQLLVLLGDLLDGGHVAGLAALERDEPDALAAAVLAPELGRAARACRSRSRSGRAGRRRAGRRSCPTTQSPWRASRMPMTPAASRPIARTSASCEAGDLALRGGDDDVVLAGRDVDPGELVAVGDRDRPDARRADALELLERGLLDDAAAGRHDEVRARARSRAA